LPDAGTPLRGRTHRTHTRVRFGDTDAAGIVFYPTFYVWFDVGTTGLLRAAAGALLDPGGTMRWPVPIVDSGARFGVPLYFDDPITIRSTIAALGRSSFRVEHVVSRGEVEVARGFEARVLVRHQGVRLVSEPLPQELRDALADGAASSEEELA
jgi:YbgC/YbaW family acyl-CoA thioester hydrolase